MKKMDFQKELNMNYSIREIKKEEYRVLNDFLYEAIYIPVGMKKPSKEIIKKDELQVYIKDFGTKEGDYCLVALVDDLIVGACWSRIMNDYGHIDDSTPSLAISLYFEYRGKGIGKALLSNMLKLLKEKGYEKVSLAVQKENYAVKLYKSLNFKVINENKEEYIMVCNL